MRRSLGAILIFLGVVCILLAFCLDAGQHKNTGDGSVSGIRYRAVPGVIDIVLHTWYGSYEQT